MKNVLSILMLSLLLISISAQTPSCDPTTCMNGQCSSGTCACSSGWLGTNCDKLGTVLPLGEFVQETITPNEWVFFYQEIDGTKPDMQVNWRASAGTITIAALLQNIESFDTPDKRNGFIKEFKAEDTVQTINFVLTGNANGRRSRFVLGIRNADPTDETSITVGVQLNLDDAVVASFTTLSITIAVALLTMILISCAMCCVYRKRRLNELLARQHAAMLQMQAMMEQEMERENYLSKEEINKYFPQKKYGELKSSYSQTTCAVCLDEFNAESMCHQLYCEHIFHVPCIEAWLVKHNSCPDCRKPITKKAIQDFLRSAKKQEKEPVDDDAPIPFDENPTGNTERINVVIPVRVEIPRPENQGNQTGSEEQASLIENPATSVRHEEPIENNDGAGDNNDENNDHSPNHNVITIEV